MTTTRFVLFSLCTLAPGFPLSAQTFNVNHAAPTFDRWNYPFNATPGTRETIPMFGGFGVPGLFDDRDGQALLGFVTAGDVPPGLGALNYQINTARVTVTVQSHETFAFDGSYDASRTFLDPADPNYVVDGDVGRPIEIFGTGFRNGLNAFAYGENFAFAFADPTMEGVRNAYAAGFDGAGNLIDVSNQVRDDFESTPFAVGQTGLPTGTLVPSGTVVSFDLDLGNPDVVGYLQHAVNEGILSLTVSSMHSAPIGGGAVTFPVLFGKESLAPDAQPATLEMSVTVVPAPAGSLVLVGLLGMARRRRGR